MTDYNDLITRLRSMDGIGDIQLNELMNLKTPMAAADAIAELVARVAYLESRLEISPEHDIDGISARDATIHHQDECISELKFRLTESEDTNKALRVRLGSELERAKELVADLQVERSFLLSERASRDKQEPVAWLDKSTEERPGDTVWLPDDLQVRSTRGLVTLYAAPPVITQHEPVTTVDDRHNADGKSCHITDDLPAGMPLYAAPPVAAPVRLTDKNIDRALSERVPGGSEVRDWFLPHDTDRGHANILTVVRAIETFVLRANGFKVEGEQ